MKRLVLAGVLLLPTLLPAATDVRYYDVEVIIFENLDPNARLAENWPTSVEQKAPEKFVQIGRPYPGPIPREYTPAYTFKPLSTSQYQLVKEAKAIEDSPSRRLLLHTAWRQPGMSWEEALDVQLQKQIPATSETDTSGQSDSSKQYPAEAGVLDGYIRVILSRYLHVETDLVFQPRTESEVFDFSEDTNQAVPAVYRLKDLRRRIRSNELHYLDHPVLGMLIVIRPFEPKGR